MAKVTSARLPIWILSGPTASGKSALAIALAQAIGGWVVNADSKQCYQELRIISARPSQAEEATVAHHLYGYVKGDAVYSAGHWLRDVAPLLQQADAQSVPLIFTGGSGLYIHSLLYGLPAIPDVEATIRQYWQDAYQQQCQQQGQAAAVTWLGEQLAKADGELWQRIDRRNPVRLLRALEVYHATQIPLSQWQQQRQPSLLAGRDIRCFFSASDTAMAVSSH